MYCTVSVAQLASPISDPTPNSKSTWQELSESVVKVSGNLNFARLDFREQWSSWWTISEGAF